MALGGGLCSFCDDAASRSSPNASQARTKNLGDQSTYYCVVDDEHVWLCGHTECEGAPSQRPAPTPSDDSAKLARIRQIINWTPITSNHRERQVVEIIAVLDGSAPSSGQAEGSK